MVADPEPAGAGLLTTIVKLMRAPCVNVPLSGVFTTLSCGGDVGDGLAVALGVGLGVPVGVGPGAIVTVYFRIPLQAYASAASILNDSNEP